MKNSQQELPEDDPIQPWLVAQRLFLENWINLASMAGSSAPPSEGLSRQWQQVVQRSLEAWAATAPTIVQNTAEQVIAAQEAALTLMAFSAKSWQTIASEVESGEDWATAYQNSLEKMSQDWSKGQENFAAIIEDSAKLWELYIVQWQKFGQPWVTAVSQAPEYYDRMLKGDSSAIIGLSNLYVETYRQTMGRIISSPYLGPTRELSEKVSQGFDSWVDWQAAVVDYQAILFETWRAATAKFMERLVELAEQGEKIESIQDLLKLWTQEAEMVFTDSFRTDEFVLAQGKMLNTAMAYRLHERVIIEEFLEIYDLPTRSELDETHRRIYELRKEVKALKKVLMEKSQGE